MKNKNKKKHSDQPTKKGFFEYETRFANTKKELTAYKYKFNLDLNTFYSIFVSD